MGKGAGILTAAAAILQAAEHVKQTFKAEIANLCPPCTLLPNLMYCGPAAQQATTLLVWLELTLRNSGQAVPE
jgi:hypothetical protein